METKMKQGKFVHVVATLNMKTGEGKIRYVEPAERATKSGAKPTAGVQLSGCDGKGKQVHKAGVVVRRSSCDHGEPGDVGLIQADLPVLAGMKTIVLTYKGEEVDRFVGGVAAKVAAGQSGA